MAAWHDALSKKYQTRRGNKYGAVKTTVGENTFDSKGESEMHQLLLLMEKKGLIKDIIHHPPVVAITQFVNYKPDFLVWDIKRNRHVYIEFKGFVGERWRVIRNLWKEFGPAPMQVWGKKGNRFFMVEELKST